MAFTGVVRLHRAPLLAFGRSVDRRRGERRSGGGTGSFCGSAARCGAMRREKAEGNEAHLSRAKSTAALRLGESACACRPSDAGVGCGANRKAWRRSGGAPPGAKAQTVCCRSRQQGKLKSRAWAAEALRRRATCAGLRGSPPQRRRARSRDRARRRLRSKSKRPASCRERPLLRRKGARD